MASEKLGFLSSLLFKWQSQATFIGRSVLPVFLLIRLVVLGAAAQTSWLNEEEEFVCNTQHKGCEVACYDSVNTLSPVRLWTLQLLLVLAPGLVYLLYLIHVTNQEHQVKTREGEVRAHTLGVYSACVIAVILIEVGFGVVQFKLDHLMISSEYACSSSSCYHTTDCIIPRATEKSVYLVVMIAASCISILLNLVEVVWVLRCRKRQADDSAAQRSEVKAEQSRCFLRQLLALWHSCAGLLGKTVLPVLMLVRLVIIGAAVKPVWDDDLRNFYCETKQPGCSQAAYNQLFPFSLAQYWTLLVVAVLAPGLIFLSYLVHLIVKAKMNGAEVEAKSHVLGAYLGILSVAFLLEVGLAASVLSSNVLISSSSHMSVSPCPYSVECHVSKSTEKSVFMCVMLFLTSLSSLLTLVEMIMTFKSWRAATKQQNNCDTSGCQTVELLEKEENIKSISGNQ